MAVCMKFVLRCMHCLPPITSAPPSSAQVHAFWEQCEAVLRREVEVSELGMTWLCLGQGVLDYGGWAV